MRLHIVGLPHTDVSRDWEHCAYTMKIHRLARMMDLYDVPMFLYASSGTDDETKQRVTDVPIVHPEDLQSWWGADKWPKDAIWNEYDLKARHWTEMNTEAAAEIAAHWQPGDVLGVIAGLCQEQIGVELKEVHGITAPVVEWGVGYAGVIPESFKVFESYAWRHYVAGTQHDDNLRWYDTVIPNAYDADDFMTAGGWITTNSESPLVFMARMTPRKGLGVVQAIAATGKYKILSCGQGTDRIDGVEHLGVVTGWKKAELLASARAVLSPTTYLGPFEGVSVEAMMAGTPAITSDWGCYTETIPGQFRATNLQEFMNAIDGAGSVYRRGLQLHAQDTWGLGVVGRQYANYFSRISAQSMGAGWYDIQD